MPAKESESARCYACVKLGQRCVNASWESLDRTRERARQQMEESFEEMELQQEALNKTMAKIARLRKTLKLAEERAESKQRCLQAELFLEDQQRWQSEQSAILQADSSLPIGPLDERSFAWLDTFDWTAVPASSSSGS